MRTNGIGAVGATNSDIYVPASGTATSVNGTTGSAPQNLGTSTGTNTAAGAGASPASEPATLTTAASGRQSVRTRQAAAVLARSAAVRTAAVSVPTVQFPPATIPARSARARQPLALRAPEPARQAPPPARRVSAPALQALPPVRRHRNGVPRRPRDRPEGTGAPDTTTGSPGGGTGAPNAATGSPGTGAATPSEPATPAPAATK